MTTTVRHCNRQRLRVVLAPGRPTTSSQGSTGEDGPTVTCRCPEQTVAGVTWAWDTDLGWHDPAEHESWTPPRRRVQIPVITARDARDLGMEAAAWRTALGVRDDALMTGGVQ
jgi:hypothetical protein